MAAARARPAEEKFLLLMRNQPAPVDLSDICKALNWTRQRGQQVSGSLASQGKIVRLRGERDGSTGRPSDLCALPEFAPPPGEKLPPKLAEHTLVVAPSGEEAKVVGMRGRTHAEIEYVTGSERGQRVTLHLRLLRAFQPGRPRPEPVRISAC